jgi:hypothetical protein
MNKKIDKNIKALFKNNKALLNEPEVLELIGKLELLSKCFEEVSIYAFATIELRDHWRKKAGLDIRRR